MIRIKDLEKRFKENIALNGINLQINENEIFGLLGPSGAGKTTLIKILTGQMKPSAGQAMVFNHETTSFTKGIYERIGMVLDEQGLYDRITAIQNLYLYADIHNIPKVKALETLEKIGLSHAKNTPVNKLSKGMKQRLTLGRAVLHEPDLLFLDEPTTGLDPRTMKEIHELIFSLRRNGTTIFLTTHNMEEATKLCDRVALLNNGLICECGSPQELSKKYDQKKELFITKRNGEKLSISNEPINADLIASLIRERDLQIIHSSEPSLEEVFIKLTGKKLEE